MENNYNFYNLFEIMKMFWNVLKCSELFVMRSHFFLVACNFYRKAYDTQLKYLNMSFLFLFLKEFFCVQRMSSEKLFLLFIYKRSCYFNNSSSIFSAITFPSTYRKKTKNKINLFKNIYHGIVTHPQFAAKTKHKI